MQGLSVAISETPQPIDTAQQTRWKQKEEIMITIFICAAIGLGLVAIEIFFDNL